MKHLGVFRRVLVLGATALALAAIAMLFVDALRVMRSSDAELLARFDGAALEDVFGFGFWPTWGLIATLVLGALAALKHLLRGSRSVYVCAVLVVAFAATSALGYWSHSREHALWEVHVNRQ